MSTDDEKRARERAHELLWFAGDCYDVHGRGEQTNCDALTALILAHAEEVDRIQAHHATLSTGAMAIAAALEAERDAAVAKLAEVTRERDEAHERLAWWVEHAGEAFPINAGTETPAPPETPVKKETA